MRQPETDYQKWQMYLWLQNIPQNLKKQYFPMTKKGYSLYQIGQELVLVLFDTGIGGKLLLWYGETNSSGSSLSMSVLHWGAQSAGPGTLLLSMGAELREIMTCLDLLAMSFLGDTQELTGQGSIFSGLQSQTYLQS